MSEPADEQASFLGVGWAFPPQFSLRTGRVATVSEEEDIRQSLRILLSTRRGERVMQPRFGCALHQLVFSELTSSTVGDIRQAIEEAIVYFEPRITVERIEVAEANWEMGCVQIDIRYVVRMTNTRSNLVYPFYFHEGTELSAALKGELTP